MVVGFESLVGTINALAIAIAIYVIGTCIYRITLHPLAKYPGPFFSKLTDWSIVMEARTGDRHLTTWEEHNRYGPIVRIGPNTLSFCTATALQAIYSSRKSKVRKSTWYRTIDAGSKAFSLHSEIDPERHAFRRRIIDQAFSDTFNEEAEEMILQNIRIWLRALVADAGGSHDGTGWTNPVNMKDWCDWLSFDLMGALTFGRDFGCIEGDKYRFVSHVALEATKFVYVAGFLPFISLVRPLVGTKWASMIFTKAAKESELWASYVGGIMQERLAEEKQDERSKDKIKSRRKDFMYHLAQARDPNSGQGLTMNELHADTALLIHAGSDTTALTLSASLFYLTRRHNAPILERLKGEVRSSFPNATAIRSGAQLNSLTYLHAVIDETLRMCPPVPSHLPREILSEQMEIDGEHLEKGTVVGVSPWAIHHNPAYYADPFSFNPERWLGELNGDNQDTAKRVKIARAAFCPFSIGPRGCAGKRLAYLEISLALATLLWTYDVRCASNSEDANARRSYRSRHASLRARTDVYQLWDYFVADRIGPELEFRKRPVDA